MFLNLERLKMKFLNIENEDFYFGNSSRFTEWQQEKSDQKSSGGKRQDE